LLEELYRWSLDASTYLAILVFLAVGLVTTVWSLALQPILQSFSLRYRNYLAQRRLDEVRPLLAELGMLNEASRIRELRRIRSGRSGVEVDEYRRQLMAIMKENFRDGIVRLGRHHSETNPYFIDLRAASMQSSVHEQLGDILANLIAREIQEGLLREPHFSVGRIVGMKEGNPLVAAQVSRKLRLPLALYRGPDFPVIHGSKEPADLFDGVVTAGEAIALVDDCTFRGTTLDGARQACEQMGARVVGVYLLFQTDKQAAEHKFSKLGVSFKSALKIDDEVLKKLRA
jgi:adenine/guanine phosphoribosyltransferase-like PRPP-binding protein